MSYRFWVVFLVTPLWACHGEELERAQAERRAAQQRLDLLQTEAASRAKTLEETQVKLVAVSEELGRIESLDKRVARLEEDVEGLGYVSVRKSWNSRRWVNPSSRCNGPETNPLSFDTKPARIRIKTGWYGSPGKKMRVRVRKKTAEGLPGDVVFNSQVEQGEKAGRYEVDLPDLSCNEIFALGLDVSPPKL